MNLIQTIPNPDTGYLLIDYPGYGISEGKPNPGSILENSEHALQTLLKKKSWAADAARPCVLAHSLGGAAALQFAARNYVRKIILVSTFTTMDEMVRNQIHIRLGSLPNGSVNTGILMRDEIEPETSNRYFRKVDSVLSGITEPSEQAYRNFQCHVDRLCLLIVASDCSDRAIDIERLHLRVQAAALFPEKMPLYEMVYESRFRRLRQQFREHP